MRALLRDEATALNLVPLTLSADEIKMVMRYRATT
jgi:hypothetical protein